MLRYFKNIWSWLIHFQHYENLFAYCFATTILFDLIALKTLIGVREYYHQSNIYTPQVIPIFLYSIPIASLFYLIKQLVRKSLQPFFFANLKQKYQGNYRLLRSIKLTKWIFDTIFYSLSVCIGISLFCDADWFPKELGGVGNDHLLMSDYPIIDHQPHLPQMEIFYIFQYSAHALSLFELIYKRNEEFKFYEMLLHHLLAASLILFSYFSNFITIGTVVLILHDIADIFMSFGRTLDDLVFIPKWSVIIAFVAMIFSWTYTRIYLLPKVVLYQAISHLGVYWGHPVFWTLAIMVTMQSILVLMHVYWTIFIYNIGFGFVSTKRFVSVYDSSVKSDVNMKGTQ